MANDIELFDRYIDNTLSPAEKRDFEERLASDRDFSTSFRVYLLSLQGVCREAEESDMEFGIAMKHLSEKDLRRLFLSLSYPGIFEEDLACGDSGPDDPDAEWPYDNGGKELPVAALYIPEASSSERISSDNRGGRLRGHLGWISTVAAVIAVAFSVVIYVEREASRSMDEVIVEYNYYPGVARGGSGIGPEYADLTALSRDQLKDALPALRKAYRDASSDDPQEAQMAGMDLVMACLMLHDRREALAILRDLQSRFADDPDFSARCATIIQQIE